MRGTCAPSGSRRRLPGRPPVSTVETDGGCCMGPLGARHSYWRRHFCVGSGRRGHGLRGARGVQRLEAHAYHTRPASRRGGPQYLGSARLIGPVAAAPGSRRGGGLVPRSCLAFRARRRRRRVGPATTPRARRRSRRLTWSYSTPPFPRATTLNFRSSVSLLRVQIASPGRTAGLLAPGRPARQRGAGQQLLRPHWLCSKIFTA